MSAATASTFAIIGTKARQYDSRFVIIRFTNGTSSREWFANASAQGREIKRMLGAGRTVESVEYE